ncbi:hypothetical protein DOTSEDRAFT_70227 [Dothistroma septosporum NZE10]|uniref:Uncharacterized protein n=1 Tax=Dothistroma septosporum (strain NZE10 / CBS 128990) TaxID=675120 RepID=N1PUS3_DOTSN|nr:hypothetical protein DOTSEDRAFT_70227 [Dothistroma septosporum NZE10]
MFRTGKLFEKKGSSGIDFMSPPSSLDTCGITLVVSQAVDSSIELIRSNWLSRLLHRGKLVIIGGEKSEASKLSQGTQLKLKS